MPPRVPIPFWMGTAEAGAKQVSAQRLVNWQLIQAPEQSKVPYYLFPTPGLTSLFSAGDGPVRGACMLGSALLVVSGQKLYSVSSALVATELGDIAGSGHVFMVSNITHTLIVTSGEHVYYTNGLNVSGHGESGLRSAAYMDGYAAAISAGSDLFYLYGPDAINTLQGFSYADKKPDHLVGVAAVGDLLWLMGEKTTEMWQHTGASFPFERAQTTDFGCRSAASIVVEDNTVWWLGDDNHVYKAQGLQPQPVSPPWIVDIIERRSSQQTAEGFVYTQDGQRQYVLTFSDLTIVYNDSTGLWHQRKSDGEDRWRVGNYVNAFGRHIVFDFETGDAYELDTAVYTENGTTIRREADSAPIHAQGARAWMHDLLVDMQKGVGLEGAGQGSDPELMLRWSDDGGHAWSNELTIKMGKIGRREVQALFNNLGMFRERVIRIAVSDPVQAVIIGAYARMEVVET